VGHGCGRIVLLAWLGAVIGVERLVGFCARKAAVVGMSNVLAMERAQHINLFRITPTLVETALGIEAWAVEVGEGAKSQFPAGRFAQPEEIAVLVLYLL
ncbi:SDR family oxidoreductase, partial [Pseudomonas syringae group genomosp. 7]|uniref:SDR family oxidoreductase n=1 Tax=Pseudomonas syringae group genomosp. 7 TaxID=251699 RepID=UPI0037702852